MFVPLCYFLEFNSNSPVRTHAVDASMWADVDHVNHCLHHTLLNLTKPLRNLPYYCPLMYVAHDLCLLALFETSICLRIYTLLRFLIQEIGAFHFYHLHCFMHSIPFCRMDFQSHTMQ